MKRRLTTTAMVSAASDRRSRGLGARFNGNRHCDRAQSALIDRSRRDPDFDCLRLLQAQQASEVVPDVEGAKAAVNLSPGEDAPIERVSRMGNQHLGCGCAACG